MNCPYCLSDDIRVDQQTLYCCTCKAHFPESDLPQMPEKLATAYSVRRNYSPRAASYPPGSQAIHGRNGAVVLISDHAYMFGCCDRPKDEHAYLGRPVPDEQDYDYAQDAGGCWRTNDCDCD